MATQPARVRSRTGRRRSGQAPHQVPLVVSTSATIQTSYHCSRCGSALVYRSVIRAHNIACADRGERSYPSGGWSMKYTQPSFSVPGSAGSKAECDRVGHTEPDRHGKCLRCAERTGRDYGAELAAIDNTLTPTEKENRIPLAPVAR